MGVMRIELPNDLVDRVHAWAASCGASESEVIRRALDSLDRGETERLAVQQGIDAWLAGDLVEVDAFDQEFRERNGIGGET